jgi:heme/copper-type cytochrome/quinol oxidase subunit 3
MTDHALAIERRAVQQTSNAVLGMLLFVISEAMFFMGFIAVYLTAYSNATVWPPKEIPIPSLGLPTAAVIVLILSVATMTMAGRASSRREQRLIVPWTAATLALAVAVAVLLGLSYRGLGIHANTDVYGSMFWVLSVVAIAHVVGGIVFFVLVLVQALAGELELRQDPLRAASIYWNFVAFIGIALYVMFYLTNAGAK